MNGRVLSSEIHLMGPKFIKGYLISNFNDYMDRALMFCDKGSFNNYVDKMRGGGGQKMSVFVHAQGIKTVHAKVYQK